MNKKSSISLFLAATSALALTTTSNTGLKAGEGDLGGLKEWNTDMDIDWHLKRSTEPLCGTIYFQRLSSFESGLNVMVQGVKELHSMLNNSVHDVWWTGLRGGALNVKWKESLTAGQINVNPIRILANNGSYQSLVQLNWAFEGVEDKLKCFVSFVVKSQEEIYVS